MVLPLLRALFGGGTSVGFLWHFPGFLWYFLGFLWYFLGGVGLWFFLTLEGLVYDLHTVGDEVHVGERLVEDLHIVGDDGHGGGGL